MEAAELRGEDFWSGRESRVLAPPRLAGEGAAIQRLLGGKGKVVFASSGSGGNPKWVSFRREALLASAEAVNRHLRVQTHDCWLLALPLYHVGGFGVAARAYAAGCGLSQFVGRWDPRRFVEDLQGSRATLTSLVPTQVHDLVVCGLRAPAFLRAVVVGGSRLAEDTGQQARDLGWPVLQSYGMTETASQVATTSLVELEENYRSGPLPVLPNWEIRLAETGCLELKGEAMFEAYLEATGDGWQEVRPFENGWFQTTDRVVVAEDGLTVLGRADRLVKILGEVVDVEAVEQAVRENLSEGSEVHLLKVPDARRGWRLVPVIENGESGGAAWIDSVNARLPGFARLEMPRFVDRLPRTSLGKINVGLLNEEFGGPGS